jgi:hypothetical protein
MAPPKNNGFSPITFPIVIQITPTVAAVPKDVPVSMETRQFKRNTMSIKIEGLMNVVDSSIIIGIVPAARQIAVIMPMRKKISRMPITCLLPSYEKRSIFLKENPFINPNVKTVYSQRLKQIKLKNET